MQAAAEANMNMIRVWWVPWSLLEMLCCFEDLLCAFHANVIVEQCSVTGLLMTFKTGAWMPACVSQGRWWIWL